MIPESLSRTGISLELEDQLARGNVLKYLKSGVIIEVKRYE